MIRRVIHIDRDLCNGCGACVNACHEGAIGLVDGKARLLRDDYCDGLGDCLPTCPTGAITFVEREAAAYDEAAVAAARIRKASQGLNPNPHASGCPGVRVRTMEPAPASDSPAAAGPSQLRNWPVQIKLAPLQAPFYQGARLLIAADCAAYAYAAFHEKFIKGHVTVIGCPKLDGVDYAEKLAQIIRLNDLTAVSVVRMQVPCCGGLENAVKRAIQESGKSLPCQVTTLSADGRILE